MTLWELLEAAKEEVPSDQLGKLELKLFTAQGCFSCSLDEITNVRVFNKQFLVLEWQ